MFGIPGWSDRLNFQCRLVFFFFFLINTILYAGPEEQRNNWRDSIVSRLHMFYLAFELCVTWY